MGMKRVLSETVPKRGYAVAGFRFERVSRRGVEFEDVKTSRGKW